MTSRLRRSNSTTRRPRTHWPRSLSGVTIMTCSTRGSSAATAAAAPRASSASYSTIAHVVTPIASNAASMTGVWASSSGGMPALVL